MTNKLVLKRIFIELMFSNHIFKYFQIGFIFTFGLLSTLIAQQPVIITDDSDKYLLGLYLEILEDPNGKLSLDSVTAPEYSSQFTPSQEEIPSYGYTKSVLWIRLKVLNERGEVSRSPWALELGYPNMHYVDLYQLSDEGKVVKVTWGTTHVVRPDYDDSVEKDLEKYFNRFMTMKVGNFKISDDEITEDGRGSLTVHPTVGGKV